eukprot:PLAT1661.1.p1 GENE.PLAT1661.1~~PLAT1661.1.p1  ORF type:complete len:329 (-),score=124.51 PLAT1661.1:67-1053(-)
MQTTRRGGRQRGRQHGKLCIPSFGTRRQLDSKAAAMGSGWTSLNDPFCERTLWKSVSWYPEGEPVNFVTSVYMSLLAVFTAMRLFYALHWPGRAALGALFFAGFFSGFYHGTGQAGPGVLDALGMTVVVLLLEAQIVWEFSSFRRRLGKRWLPVELWVLVGLLAAAGIAAIAVAAALPNSFFFTVLFGSASAVVFVQLIVLTVYRKDYMSERPHDEAMAQVPWQTGFAAVEVFVGALLQLTGQLAPCGLAVAWLHGLWHMLAAHAVCHGLTAMAILGVDNERGKLPRLDNGCSCCNCVASSWFCLGVGRRSPAGRQLAAVSGSGEDSV